MSIYLKVHGHKVFTSPTRILVKETVETLPTDHWKLTGTTKEGNHALMLTFISDPSIVVSRTLLQLSKLDHQGPAQELCRVIANKKEVAKLKRKEIAQGKMKVPLQRKARQRRKLPAQFQFMNRPM